METSSVPPLPHICSSATIIDFMPVTQALSKSGLETFGQLADRIETCVASSFKESNVIAIVPDRDMIPSYQ